VERGNDVERQFWRRTLEAQEQDEADLGHAIALMREHGTLADTLERARLYGNAALAALEPFPDSEAKRALVEVVDFCLERGY
jgi:octaprenyl-diphosphate synthase